MTSDIFVSGFVVNPSRIRHSEDVDPKAGRLLVQYERRVQQEILHVCQTLGFVAATGLMTGLSSAANALPVTVPDLVAHRAVYDLELKDASDRSGIEGMTGRMVYEFTGSSCQGYKTDFRFVTQINTGDAVRMTDQQTTTFEDLAAKKFTFETKSYTDDKLDKEVQGPQPTAPRA